MSSNESDLGAALNAFDRASANLVKLEAVWSQIEAAMPEDVAFGLNSPEVASLLDAYGEIVGALPPIDGFRIEAVPMSPDELAQNRFDAWEIGEPLARIAVEDEAAEPGRQIAIYRRRLEGARRRLVRERVSTVAAMIEKVLADAEYGENGAAWRGTDRWPELSGLVSELDRLAGSLVPGRARWSDLHRHIRFAQECDLFDIITTDWPSVKLELETSLYDDREPMPVGVDDLGELVRARPTGPVGTVIDWMRLDDEAFERLVFELIRQAEGYENANWLMRTNAPDRGRDIEVQRIVQDALGDTKRYRVIVQCKHWKSRSVGRGDLIECVESVTLWEPPKVDTLIIATSGRFSQDAVALKEKRDLERDVPSIELWPDNHLELLLARRPHIAANFGLR